MKRVSVINIEQEGDWLHGLLKAYEQVLSGSGWTRLPGDANSLILQWRHPNFAGYIHLSLGGSDKRWRHYISAPFPSSTGADVESLRRYLSGDATAHPDQRGATDESSDLRTR